MNGASQNSSSTTVGFTRTRRRLVGSGALLALGTVVGAACGSVEQGPPQADTARPSPAAPVALTFWSGQQPTDRLRLGVQAALDDFQARSGARVTIENTDVGGTGNAMAKMTAALAAGTQPNLWGGDTQTAATSLLVLDAVVDLNQALRTSKDWGRIKADLFPSVIEGISWKGKIPFMPMMLAQEALGFNKHILQRVGVPAPSHGFTWTDFLQLGQRTTNPPDVVLFPFPYNTSWLTRLMHSNGVVPLSSDRTKLLFGTPPMIETLQWAHDQVTKGVARNGPSGFNDGGSVTESANEAAAATPPRFPNIDPNGDGTGLHVTHYPFGPSNTKKAVITFANTRGLIVLKTSDGQKNEAGARVAEWAGRADVQPKIAEASGHPPVGLTAARPENLPAKIKNNVILKTINDFGKGAYLTPNFPNWSRAMAILQENLTRVANGEILPKDALLDSQQKMQPLIDEDLRRG